MWYRKKPITVEAMQWHGDNWHELMEFVGDALEIKGRRVYINTLEGTMEAGEDDFIIKGIKGEFYPCKPDIFEGSYDPVA